MRVIWSSGTPKKFVFSYGDTRQLVERKNFIVKSWFMCHGDWEWVHRLLIHCQVVRDLWSLVFAVLELNWVMPRSVRGLL